MSLMAKMNVLLVNANAEISKMFRDTGANVKNTSYTNTVPHTLISQQDIVVICSAKEIEVPPTLYGSIYTLEGVDSKHSTFDVEVVKSAVREGVGVAGIGYGAQLLCVLEGGSLTTSVRDVGQTKVSIEGLEEEYNLSSSHIKTLLPSKQMEVVGVKGTTTEICRNKDRAFLCYQPDPLLSKDLFFNLLQDSCI